MNAGFKFKRYELTLMVTLTGIAMDNLDALKHYLRETHIQESQSIPKTWKTIYASPMG